MLLQSAIRNPQSAMIRGPPPTDTSSFIVHHSSFNQRPKSPAPLEAKTRERPDKTSGGLVMSRSNSTPQPRRHNPDDRDVCPCDTCDRRDTCTSTCERLERLLPKPREGGQMHFVPNEILDCLADWQTDYGEKNRVLFEIFFEHREALSKRQWQCVELVYGEDLSKREAARRLGLNQSSVSRYIARACRKLLNKVCINPCINGGATRNGGDNDTAQ